MAEHDNLTHGKDLTLRQRAAGLFTKLFSWPVIRRKPEIDLPDPLAADFTFDRPFQITIDGKNYMATSWRTIEAPQVLERNYDKGWLGGSGVFSEDAQTQPGQFYFASNCDTLTFPYIRLRPTTIMAVPGDNLLSGANPCYFWIAEDSGGTEYLYVGSKKLAKKIDLTTFLVDEDIDFGQDAKVGRPILYEGFWRIPLGEKVRTVHLATVAVPGSGEPTDTFTPVADTDEQRYFTHFAHHQAEGVAQIAAAHNDDPVVDPAKANQVSFSALMSTPAFGGSIECGDNTLEITDMHSIGGQLFISKPDSPWRLSNDGGGNAYPVIEFVGKQQYLSGALGEDGANSHTVGPYAYWTSTSGLWRVIGDQARPIDPGANRRWVGISLDSIVPTFLGRFTSMASWGRWVYASDSITGVWQGYLNDDGTISWGSAILHNGAIFNVGIVGSSTGPILAMVDSVLNNIYIIPLDGDGSTRRILISGSSDPGRGNGEGLAETAQFWAPETSFGTNGEKNMQLRGGWIEIDELQENLTVTLRVHRDRNKTSTQVGAAITSSDGDGRHEFKMTPGTNDTFRRLMPAVRIVQSSSWDEDNGDLRIRGFGLRAVTPHVYQIQLPLDGQTQRGTSSSRFDAIRNLRNLKSGLSVTVKEAGLNATFTGYITDVQEQVTMVRGIPTWMLVITMERWVL